jgi:hypothetical protein
MYPFGRLPRPTAPSSSVAGNSSSALNNCPLQQGEASAAAGGNFALSPRPPSPGGLARMAGRAAVHGLNTLANRVADSRPIAGQALSTVAGFVDNRVEQFANQQQPVQTHASAALNQAANHAAAQASAPPAPDPVADQAMAAATAYFHGEVELARAQAQAERRDPVAAGAAEHQRQTHQWSTTYSHYLQHCQAAAAQAAAATQSKEEAVLQAARNVLWLRKSYIHSDSDSSSSNTLGLEKAAFLELPAHPMGDGQKTAGEMLTPYFVQMLPRVDQADIRFKEGHGKHLVEAAAQGLLQLNTPEMAVKKNRIASNPELVLRIRDATDICSLSKPERLDLRMAILEVALGLPYRPNNRTDTGEVKRPGVYDVIRHGVIRTTYGDPPDVGSFNQRLLAMEAASGVPQADFGPLRAGPLVRRSLLLEAFSGERRTRVVDHNANHSLYEQSGEVLRENAPQALVAQRTEEQQTTLAAQRLRALEQANGLSWSESMGVGPTTLHPYHLDGNPYG